MTGATPNSDVRFHRRASLATIRIANRSDAPALARIAERTFRSTFGSANSAEDMDLHCQRSYGVEIQGGEIDNPTMVTLLCEAEGGVIGFAQLRLGHASECFEATTPVEIQRLYVAGEWHGKGVAQLLMGACIDQALRHRSDAIWLGVWERNLRAIAFYRKHGFVEVGEHCFYLGSEPQRDAVMVKPLTIGANET